MTKNREDKFLDSIKANSFSKDSKISVFPVYSVPIDGTNYGIPKVTTNPSEAWKCVEEVLKSSDGIEVRIDGVRLDNWS